MAQLGRIPWWEWVPGRRWRIVAMFDAADEIPEHLPRKGAVLVGSPQHPKWLAFDCPCRTGHRIMVTLDHAHFPHWTVGNDLTRLSLSPSVDYRVPDRRCHYIIKNGSTSWVRNKEERRRGR